MTSAEFPTVTIRPAYADDAMAITRLAALDSASVPRGPLVVAEVDGELRVAVSVDEFTVIADPFHRTAELVALLRDHIDRVRRSTSSAEHTRRPTTMLRGRQPRLA